MVEGRYGPIFGTDHTQTNMGFGNMSSAGTVWSDGISFSAELMPEPLEHWTTLSGAQLAIGGSGVDIPGFMDVSTLNDASQWMRTQFSDNDWLNSLGSLGAEAQTQSHGDCGPSMILEDADDEDMPQQELALCEGDIL
jgi:hypothetical protein